MLFEFKSNEHKKWSTQWGILVTRNYLKELAKYKGRWECC